MRAALRQLGYVDTYHMMNASVENPPDCLMWQDAFAAKYDGIGKFTREDWDQLLGHCQALCDWPASAFAKELIEAYPNAKVVLIGRDLDSWHASTMKTVWWRVCDPELRIASYVSWGASMYYPMLKKFFDTFFEGDFPNKGKEIYKRHYKEVRDMVPPENLLEYQISDGWGPLCDFLGEDIPCVKFPRCNDTAGFKERCRWRNRMQMCNAALRFALYGGILLGGLYALSRAYKSFSA
ncbi:MAG: hypothetical protein M1819_003503 [Sarea resinae]|nr:MAG: hypothetical protein M1819_003503 [Sarea resinae]